MPSQSVGSGQKGAYIKYMNDALKMPMAKTKQTKNSARDKPRLVFNEAIWLRHCQAVFHNIRKRSDISLSECPTPGRIVFLK